MVRWVLEGAQSSWLMALMMAELIVLTVTFRWVEVEGLCNMIDE